MHLTEAEMLIYAKDKLNVGKRGVMEFDPENVAEVKLQLLKIDVFDLLLAKHKICHILKMKEGDLERREEMNEWSQERMMEIWKINPLVLYEHAVDKLEIANEKLNKIHVFGELNDEQLSELENVAHLLKKAIKKFSYYIMKEELLLKEEKTLEVTNEFERSRSKSSGLMNNQQQQQQDRFRNFPSSLTSRNIKMHIEQADKYLDDVFSGKQSEYFLNVSKFRRSK